MTPRHQTPMVGDVLVMPGGNQRRIKSVDYYVTYTYTNANGARQRVSPRKRAWLAAVRKALREGGRYWPVEDQP